MVLITVPPPPPPCQDKQTEVEVEWGVLVYLIRGWTKIVSHYLTTLLNPRHYDMIFHVFISFLATKLSIFTLNPVTCSTFIPCIDYPSISKSIFYFPFPTFTYKLCNSCALHYSQSTTRRRRRRRRPLSRHQLLCKFNPHSNVFFCLQELITGLLAVCLSPIPPLLIIWRPETIGKNETAGQL